MGILNRTVTRAENQRATRTARTSTSTPGEMCIAARAITEKPIDLN
jgi:hypothetical protein